MLYNAAHDQRHSCTFWAGGSSLRIGIKQWLVVLEPWLLKTVAYLETGNQPMTKSDERLLRRICMISALKYQQFQRPCEVGMWADKAWNASPRRSPKKCNLIYLKVWLYSEFTGHVTSAICLGSIHATGHRCTCWIPFALRWSSSNHAGRTALTRIWYPIVSTSSITGCNPSK